MRKLILILALVMVPLGIWTAGCRNGDSAAAFPDTPEMDALAASGGKVSEVADASAAGSVPFIPEKPIDRDILRTPGSDTLARVRAVNDRANRYAAQVAAEDAHGLFTLPEERNYVASAFSAPAVPHDAAVMRAGMRTDARADAPGEQASAIPAPSAREFWSRPVAEHTALRTANAANTTVPGDVSAMAAPAVSGSAGSSFLPPAPSRAVSRRAQDALILPPDDMPGIFMAGEEDGADALFSDAFSEASSTRVASLRMTAAPAALRVPAAPSPAVVESGFAAFPSIPQGARIVSSEGMDFEPLPEPMPISRYNAMVLRELESGMPGKPAAAPAPVPVPVPVPAKREVKPIREVTAEMSAPVLPLPAALISAKPVIANATPSTPVIVPVPAPGANQARQAPTPLPDLSSLLPTPEKSSMKGKAAAKSVAMPAPMPKALPTPEAMAAKAELMAFAPEAAPAIAPATPKTVTEKAAKKSSFLPPPPAKKADPLPAIPELTDPVSSFLPVPPPLAEPKKVTLQPIRKLRAEPTLEEIDAATEVPPLKF